MQNAAVFSVLSVTYLTLIYFYRMLNTPQNLRVE